jgi:hypothetical protein
MAEIGMPALPSAKKRDCHPAAPCQSLAFYRAAGGSAVISAPA